MLSSWRNLGPSSPQESVATEGEQNDSGRSSLEHNSRSATMSSGQLAESALSNLRKSLASQRSPSPVKGTPSPPPAAKPAKSRLEDRLRAAAALASGDASARASPDRVSSPDATVPTDPLSPSSIPLPTSPPAIPASETNSPPSLVIDADTSKPEPSDHERSGSQQSGRGNGQTSSVQTGTPSDEDQTTLDIVSEVSISVADSAVNDTSQEPNDARPEVSAVGSELSSAQPPSPSPEQEPGLDTSAYTLRSEQSRQQPEVEALQERLKVVEERFADVSKSFKRLQAEKLAADGVLKEFKMDEGAQNPRQLREFLQANADQMKLYREEAQQLTQRLTQQEERLGEMREMHLMESQSQSKEIEKLCGQLKEADVLIQASQGDTERFQAEKGAHASERDQLRKELEQQKNITKEEEEKRVKAISLLKTVRQKSVKSEKDREEAVKELATLKEQVDQERRKIEEERVRFRQELEEANTDSENAKKGLRAQFDKEISGLKERHKKELTSCKSQAELEVVTLQNTHSQELTARNSKISSLENSVRKLVEEKNSFFDQLQVCQAELESSQTHLESLRSQNTELEFQLRGAENKTEASIGRETEHQSMTSAEEVASLLSSAEAKYQVKVADLKRTIAALERERNEGESEWNRRLREKNKEADELRRVLESNTKTRERSDETLTDLQQQIGALNADISRRAQEMLSLQSQIQQLRTEKSVSDVDITETRAQKRDLEQRVEELSTRETQLRAANKNLKDELRKVQSSAALLEKQRNPGIGYWTSQRNGDQAASRTSLSSAPDTPPTLASQGAGASSPASPASTEEQVNLEYLRNVILQFLEHKEMRPNLVKVLSIILQFTPQETRRLTAKI